MTNTKMALQMLLNNICFEAIFLSLIENKVHQNFVRFFFFPYELN